MRSCSRWRQISPLLLASITLGWSSLAQAAPRLTYSPLDLRAGPDGAPRGLPLHAATPSLPALPPSGTKVMLRDSNDKEVAGCTLTIQRPAEAQPNEAWVTSDKVSACDALWKAEQPAAYALKIAAWPGQAALTVTLQPATAATRSQTVQIKAPGKSPWTLRETDLQTLASNQALLDPKLGWLNWVSSKDGMLTVPSSIDRSNGKPLRLRVFRETQSGGFEDLDLTLIVDAASEPDEPQTKAPVASVEENDRAEAFASCVDPAGRGRQVLCVDAYDPRTGKVRTPEITGAGNGVHVLRPNASVLVMVRYPEDRGVKISMQGERGLTALSIKDESGQEKTRVAKNADSPPPPPRPQFAWRSFAPRKPGNADVRVQILDGTTVVAEETLEMIVETTYIGALRVGLSMVGGGALDRGYEARAVGGTATPQVVQKDGSVVQPELVVGFAPFVIEALAGRGRGYSGQESFASRLFRLAPYVGLGVLTNSPNGIDGFKSFYFGAEWELAPSFSVAFTGVVRRVTRLGSGVQEGSPAPDGSVPTQTQHDLGWGVVVNITPSFLRLANQPASGFFR